MTLLQVYSNGDVIKREGEAVPCAAVNEPSTEDLSSPERFSPSYIYTLSDPDVQFVSFHKSFFYSRCSSVTRYHAEVKKVSYVFHMFLFPSVLLTGVHVVHALAAPAVDVAAPHKLALAALDVSDHVCVVSSAAAQQVAAVRPRRRPVAPAPSGARDAPPPVLQTVVWRLVEEDELVFVYMETLLVLPLHLPLGSLSHLHAVLVSILQIRPDPLKRHHRPPACLHRAGARNTVTTTVCGHCPVDRLQTQTGS